MLFTNKKTNKQAAIKTLSPPTKVTLTYMPEFSQQWSLHHLCTVWATQDQV